MSDKDQKFTRLQHDLRDGRIKLRDDHVFKRECLGEWRDDRADAMVYTATAVKPFIVEHRCAFCSDPIAFAPGVYTQAQIDQRIADHHAVCPKRPIEVGDYVEGKMHDRAWVRGRADRRVTGCEHEFVVAVDACSDSARIALGQELAFGREALRRIPRPAEAQATVPPVPVLVDGLTRAQCLAAYTCAQNEELPGGVEFLSDAQRTAGQEEWSAALRSKVAASAEAERFLVRVDLQDLD